MKKIFLLMLALGALPAQLLAAAPKLYLSGPSVPIAIGSEFVVKILLDTPQAVNAYGLDIGHTPNLSVSGFDNSHSVIDVWQGEPQVEVNGGIPIVGGSLKPFLGDGAELLSVRFKAVASGPAEIKFGKRFVYLANGKGTRVEATSESLRSNVSEFGIPTFPPKTIDEAPPVVRSLTITNDPFYPKRKLLGFSLKDEGSGVKNAEVRTKSFFAWGDWQPALNPVAVDASAWAIGFRVSDNAGNIYETTIYNWRSAIKPALVAIGVLILILLFILINTLKNRRRRYNNQR